MDMQSEPVNLSPFFQCHIHHIGGGEGEREREGEEEGTFNFEN